MNRKTLLKRAAFALAGIATGALGMECAKRADAATDAKPDDTFAMSALGMRHVWDTPEEDAAWSHLQGPETETSNRDRTEWTVSDHPCVPMTREQIDAVVASWGDQPLKVQGRRWSAWSEPTHPRS